MRRALAAAADLVLRRRPLAALAVALAADAALPVDAPFALLALVPLYGAAVHRPWRAAAAGVAAVALAELVHLAVWGSRGGLAAVAATTGFAVVVAAIGSAVRERRRGAAREQTLLAERAVAEERLRIARELHDAVGHDVSLMVVQAQALGATNDDEGVRAATAAIADAGRRAMTEMHRTLQILRDGDTGDTGDSGGDGGAGAARAPQPGLAALDEVLDGARAAGVSVRIAMEGAARPLDPALDASAFRIVQEAVTNVVRHAGGAPATVTVRYLPAALEVLVTDEGGGGRATDARVGGHGLVGMRERAALFGGTLSAGPRNGRGFEVRAVLPYPDREAAP